VDQAGYPNWYGLIRPFTDAPEVTVGVIFYQVPTSNPSCYPTVFNNRIWDHRENWDTTAPTTVPGSLVPYFGEVPDGRFGKPIGAPDWFITGIRYEAYKAGLYQNPVPCIPFGWKLEAKHGRTAGSTGGSPAAYASFATDGKHAGNSTTIAGQYAELACRCHVSTSIASSGLFIDSTANHGRSASSGVKPGITIASAAVYGVNATTMIRTPYMSQVTYGPNASSTIPNWRGSTACWCAEIVRNIITQP
jgi:hypothetical protein